jgi:HlyD family secretion protein
VQRLEDLPDPNTVAQTRVHFDKATVALRRAQAAYDTVKHRPDVAMLPQALTLQQSTIDFEAAAASLDAAQLEAPPAMLAAAQAHLAAAQARLAQLEAGSLADELNLAELQMAKAQAELDQLTAGPSAAGMRQREVAVRAAELALRRAESDLEAASLTAPFAGTVLEVSACAGEMVASRIGLVRLADSSALEVEATVIEEDLPLLRADQEVELYFDAQPDAEVQGHLARIVPKRLPGDRPLYPVYIEAEDLPRALLAGMTVDASIVIDSRHDVLRLPRALVRSRSDGTATIQIWTGTVAEDRAVRTGMRGDAYVEILEGLHEGEQVVAQ